MYFYDPSKALCGPPLTCGREALPYLRQVERDVDPEVCVPRVHPHASSTSDVEDSGIRGRNRPAVTVAAKLGRALRGGSGRPRGQALRRPCVPAVACRRSPARGCGVHDQLPWAESRLEVRTGGEQLRPRARPAGEVWTEGHHVHSERPGQPCCSRVAEHVGPPCTVHFITQ